MLKGMVCSTMNKEAFIKGLLKNIGGVRTTLSKLRGERDIAEEAMKLVSHKTPEWFKKSVHGVNPDKAWKGMIRQNMSSGDGSLLLWPIKSLAEKVIGGAKGVAKVRGSSWKYISAPAMRADAAVGRVLEKIPGGKTLFRVKEKVPWGKGLEKEITRSSALAPLMKARDIAEPILIGVGLEKGIKALTKKRDQGDKNMNDQHLREKAASVMLHLHEKNEGHEKRGQALRLLYKKAELGYEVLPKTYGELETKLAALVTEDLIVLEKALELAGGNVKLGELDSRDPKAAVDSAEKFQAAILGDEL